MAEFLKYLTDDDEKRLLEGANHRTCSDGEVILAEGETRHALNILQKGKARVERMHGEFTVEVSQLEEGELFGEMSFVEDFEASASVVADGTCVVDVIPGEYIRELLAPEPDLAVRFYHSIAEILSRRLRATTVEGVSEFSWGSGFDTQPEEQTSARSTPDWGGGSPLRDALEPDS